MAKDGKKLLKSRLEPTLTDVVGILQTMNHRMDNTDVRLSVMERDISKIKNSVADMQDDLTTALAAVDKEGEMLYDHERRIKKLERAR